MYKYATRAGRGSWWCFCGQTLGLKMGKYQQHVSNICRVVHAVGSRPAGALSTHRSRMCQTCNHTLFPKGSPWPEKLGVGRVEDKCRCSLTLCWLPSLPVSPSHAPCSTCWDHLQISPSLLLGEPTLAARHCACSSHPFSRPLSKF